MSLLKEAERGELDTFINLHLSTYDKDNFVKD